MLYIKLCHLDPECLCHIYSVGAGEIVMCIELILSVIIWLVNQSKVLKVLINNVNNFIGFITYT